MSQINELVKRSHENAKEKGFWDDGRNNIGEKLMLIVSELGEALESDRKSKFADVKKYRDNTIFSKMMKKYVKGSHDEEMDSTEFAELEKTKQFESHIKDTFEDELADTVIRIFDLAGSKNIDLEFHILEKMKYNSKREKLHGKKY